MMGSFCSCRYIGTPIQETCTYISAEYRTWCKRVYSTMLCENMVASVMGRVSEEKNYSAITKAF